MKKITLITLALAGLFAFSAKAQSPVPDGSTLSASPQNTMTRTLSSNTSSQNSLISAFSSNMNSQNATTAEFVLSQTSGSMADGGVACGDSGAGTTGDNFYMRDYILGNYGVTGTVLLTGIEFYPGTASGQTQLEVHVYNFPGFPAGFDVTSLPAPLASGYMIVDGSTVGTLVRIEFDNPGIADQNSHIVAVIFEPDGQTAQFYLTTAAAETQTSYLASVACGINAPTPVGNIGFPDSKHIINLVVDTDAEPPLAITCVPDALRSVICQYTVIGNEFDATFTGNGTLTNNLNGTATIAGEVLSIGTTTVVWTLIDSNGQTESCTTIITVSNTTGILSQTSGAIGDGGVACGDSGAGTTGDNFYARSYNLAAHGVTGNVPLTGIEFYVSTSSGTTQLEVAIYEYAGFPTGFDVTNLPAPLASGLFTVNPSMEGSLVQADFTSPALVNQNSNIIAVVHELDGQTAQFYLGTQTTETQPSYLASIACGIETPTPVSDIGFPDAKHIINLMITVDSDPLAISCIPNAVRSTDAGVSYYTVVGNEFDATYTDNCSTATLTNSRNGTSTLANEVLPIGNTTIVWTVNDINGQTASCTTVITVEENISLTITCAPNATRDTNLGVCQYAVIGNEFDANFTGNGTLTNNLNGTATLAGRVLPKGATSVVWTVIGSSGQSVSCTMTITVEDNEAPQITCIPGAVRGTDVGVSYYTVVGNEFDATFTDNCSTATITNSRNGTSTLANEVLPIGNTTIVWTVNDGNGQTATCTTVITVEENISLTITCAPNATRSTNLGVCQYTVIGNEFDAIFTGNGTLTNNLNGTATLAGRVLPKGVTSVVWTVTGGNGQTISCTMTITIEDNEAPIVSCPSDQLVETGAGNQYYVLPDYFATGEATASDNCTGPVTNLIQDPASGTELPEGVHTITISATDESGNITSCSFDVTVDVTVGIVYGVKYETILLYPNPSKDILNVSNPKNIKLNSASIYDISGRLIQTTNLTEMTSEISLDISKLSSATYMIMISGDDGQISKLIVKEK